MINNENLTEENVQQELVGQEVGQPVVSDQVVNPEAEQVEKAEPEVRAQKPSVDYNMRNLREKSDRLARERDDAIARLREMEAKNATPEEDLSFNLASDDLAEGKHLNKLQKQIRKQNEELMRQQQQTRALLVDTKLKSEFPDISKVVTAEALEALKEAEPELAESLASTTDYYSKAKAAYKMIKKFGIYVDDNYASERETVQRNAAKPRPLAAVSPQTAESPLSRANAFANGLTNDLKEQLYREMLDSIKSE